MKHVLSIVVLLLLVPAAFGSGWNDFEQPLGGGYSIFRANTQDITLTHDNDVLTGHDPLVAFVETPTHIFTEHWGADGSKSYYVVQKQPENVAGPMTLQAFASDPMVVAAGALKWQVPTNPHPEVARRGQIMFVILMLAMWVGVYVVPFVLVVAVIGILIWWVRRSRNRNQPISG